MKIILFLFTISSFAFGYVYTRTLSGEKLKWNIRGNTVPLVYSTTNSQGLNTSSVATIFESSITEWSGTNSEVSISTAEVSSSSLGSYQNRMYFSSDSSFFGTGVLAVTAINYDEVSGNISSADILINDSGFFGSFSLFPSSSSNSVPYLGDVITHEIGHFYGLNHSEVIGSTMMYNVFKGQYTISNDDSYGIAELYGENEGYNSSITGRVVGEDGIPVFGAHVQILRDGLVDAGQFTDEDGRFEFKAGYIGAYNILVSPMKSKENISDYFRNVRSNFCNGEDFQPSMFSSCDSRDIGVGQKVAINLDINGSLSTDIGDLTVRCSTPVNPEYLRTKFSEDTEDYFLTYDYVDSGKNHGGHTGYFTEQQVDIGSLSTPDKLKLDLSNYPVTNTGTYVNVQVYTTALGSPFGINLGYKSESAGAYSTLSPSTDSIGKIDTNISVALPMSTTTSENIFDLSITPFTLSSTQKSEIFGNAEVLANSNYIYYLDFQIVDTDVPLSTSGQSNDFPYNDNAACLEGDVGTTSQAYRSIANSNVTTEETGFGCGTVDFDNDDNGNGPFSLMIGLMLVLMLGFVREKLNDFFV